MKYCRVIFVEKWFSIPFFHDFTRWLIILCTCGRLNCHSGFSSWFQQSCAISGVKGADKGAWYILFLCLGGVYLWASNTRLLSTAGLCLYAGSCFKRDPHLSAHMLFIRILIGAAVILIISFPLGWLCQPRSNDLNQLTIRSALNGLIWPLGVTIEHVTAPRAC